MRSGPPLPPLLLLLLLLRLAVMALAAAGVPSQTQNSRSCPTVPPWLARSASSSHSGSASGARLDLLKSKEMGKATELSHEKKPNKQKVGVRVLLLQKVEYQ
jgi:hypothetical protein